VEVLSLWRQKVEGNVPGDSKKLSADNNAKFLSKLG